MKNNKLLRIASILLVVTLLSTCVVSGTFAKYLTTDSGDDTARVAKWGVTALVSGSLFGENYYPVTASSNGNEISASAEDSVDTSANDNIVAPGTQNMTGLTLKVSGTPEVANIVTVSQPSGVTNSDIWLKAGQTYGTLVEASGVNADNFESFYILDNGVYKLATGTTYDSSAKYYELHDVVAVSATKDGKYYPIQWTLTDGTTPATYSTTADLKGAIEDAFNTATNSQNDPNDPIDTTYTVTWAWAFEGQQDGADTILGNLQAAVSTQKVVKLSGTNYVAAVNNEDYCLIETFGIQLTVTQVD